MFEELNRRISRIKETRRAKQKLISERSFIEELLAAEKSRYADLEAALVREGKDVAKLEGFSLVGLFYTILGSKDEQLEKERQEYLAAKLKYDECKDSLGNLEKQLTEVEKRIGELGNVDHEFAEVLAEKERLLLTTKGGNAGRILELQERISDNQIRIKELKEALEAGNSLLAEIRKVTDSLESAERWGTWDLIGGGLLATAIKHSRIDDARAAAHRVQQQLRFFVKELKDVDPHFQSGVNIDIGGFLTFADYFIDGLIADWVVLSRIKNSLAQTLSLGNKVLETIKYLQQMLAASEQELALLEKEKLALIEEG